MGNYFGTDGIRAASDAAVLQAPFLRRLAAATFSYIGKGSGATIAIGRDPRHSGTEIVQVLTEAWARAGVRILDCGVAPTPAVALAVMTSEADLGVMVTASHNPARDNGIKFFSAEGTKLSESDEAVLEGLIDSASPLSDEDGGACIDYPAVENYVTFALQQAPADLLRGFKIVLDCANGATVATSPRVLRELGADLVVLGDRPDGNNINLGVGSEHPEKLAEAVRRSGAQLGIAHDGDGDRVLFVDETGAQVPGDVILGLVGSYLVKNDALHERTIVATVMSNLGLDRAIEAIGGRVLRAGVGDRQVFYKMVEGGFGFGGESSGHLILREWLPTGDGLTAAITFLQAWMAAAKPVSTWATSIPLFPQRLVNLAVESKPPLAELPDFEAGLAAITKNLGSRGRILVRYSGTENKIRLLAEAEDANLVDQTLLELQSLAEAHLDLTK
jgi:phosphoglucosamine mutase